MSKVASFSRLPNARKTFVVGLDGSNLSFQAIRTAAFQMDTMRDNMLIVTLKKNADDAATFERAHVRAKEIAMFYVPVPAAPPTKRTDGLSFPFGRS